MSELKIYNTLERKIVPFSSIREKQVGIYWCGPTTYSPAHLGHARSAVVLDLLTRTLAHLGYEVRSIRNITDVGHLLGDGEQGEDKIGKTAKKEGLHPMAISQRYINSYHREMEKLNMIDPTIEPLATGHITQQIELVSLLLNKGSAYISNGSVYFDLVAHEKKHGYGQLSKKRINELLSGTRSLDGQNEKRSPLDFALWKKADKSHIMQWDSPWGMGFPGWHLECSVLSHTYLGTPFDIHGGGLELCFPHHECEIAQCVASSGSHPARFWIHHNMVTLEGKKMSKSTGHFVDIDSCFTGNHPLLSRGYEPMAVRLLLLQAHYRSTLDFSDSVLKAAQKAYIKLINGLHLLDDVIKAKNTTSIKPNESDRPKETELEQLAQSCYSDLYNDLNTPKVLANLFTILSLIRQEERKDLSTSFSNITLWEKVHKIYKHIIVDILGLSPNPKRAGVNLLPLLIELYERAKKSKDYETSDKIRETLIKKGFSINEGIKRKLYWEYV